MVGTESKGEVLDIRDLLVPRSAEGPQHGTVRQLSGWLVHGLTLVAERTGTDDRTILDRIGIRLRFRHYERFSEQDPLLNGADRERR